MRYAIIIEKGRTKYGAYVPDIPGCVAIGTTIEEVRQSISETLSSHLQGLQEQGEEIPQPVSMCEYVEVD